MKEQKNRTAVLGTILAVSLVINCAQFLTAIGSGQQRAPSPVGTYRTGDIYIVLDRDGNYCLYRQPTVLEVGVYEPGEMELGQYLLRRTPGGELLGQVFLREDGLYQANSEGRMTAFPRVSEIPIFAGIEYPFPGS